MTITWPFLFFIITSSVSVPVYIFILFIILFSNNRTFDTTFYKIIILQGFADILATVIYFLFSVLRTLGYGHSVFWALQNSFLWYFGAPFIFHSTYLLILVRCFGVFLIALHRFICICGKAEWRTIASKLSHLSVSIALWIPPLVICIPILMVTDMYFNNELELHLVLDTAYVKNTNMITQIVIFTSFASSIILYISISQYVLLRTIDTRLKREVKMLIQGTGVLLALTPAFIHHLLLFFYADKEDIVAAISAYHPLSYCIMSNLNPWTTLILNTELRNAIIQYSHRKLRDMPY